MVILMQHELRYQVMEGHSFVVILDHLIEQNANRNIIFDFEGSDIKGVKEFYKSFGHERKVYPELYIDNSPLWLTLVQKVKQFISF